ncbi:response regulator [Novosphingobium sp. PS1R-30]|uniref:Response regulator n=1 Tax=Novosphingobium anseongense TaxID=3133436 RepID=A0ABU8S2J5_9SPHN
MVEDEPLIRMLAVEMVEDAGFVAIEAVNADDAILILEARSDIRVVFTDIQMPGSLDGMRLAARVRDLWPPIEIIITSGNVTRDKVVLPSRAQFVPKPYRPAEVIGLLERMAR